MGMSTKKMISRDREIIRDVDDDIRHPSAQGIRQEPHEFSFLARGDVSENRNVRPPVTKPNQNPHQFPIPSVDF
jgi:hypothetical protein